MHTLKDIFVSNKKWAATKKAIDPDYFEKLSQKQTPNYFWIGCSDSRVPANEITGLAPGELFVHRNIANLFLNDDLNAMSVLQYAVENLKIEHIIVCGHYGCGGIEAALENNCDKFVNSWLSNIRDVYNANRTELEAITDPPLRHNRLVELNVLQQVTNICQTDIVQNAWKKQQPLTVHGWIYEIAEGKLHDFGCCISNLETPTS